MKYTIEKLRRYAEPLSETETDACKHSINMVAECLRDEDLGIKIRRAPQYREREDAFSYEAETSLGGNRYTVLLQGSYANNTNIKRESDVDVAVIWEDKPFSYHKTPDGYSGFGPNSYCIDESKRKLVEKFGDIFGPDMVEMGKKSIKIKENTYHKRIDVVPCVRLILSDYRSFDSFQKRIPGICIIGADGKRTINFPEVHLENGREKNNRTNHMYKKIVRIIKNIHRDCLENGTDMPITRQKLAEIKSFVLECLVYNVPDGHFIPNDLAKSLKNVIKYLWRWEGQYYRMHEINGINLLFGQERPSAIYREFFKLLYLHLWIDEGDQ